MSFLGYVLLFTAASLCTAAPASDGSCARPPRLDHAALLGDWDDDSYPQDKLATYQCRPGYSRLGTIRMTCKNGNWSDVFPKGQCRKKSCGHPGDIPFGSFQLTGEESFVFGAVVEYSCDEGYRMVSKEKKRQCTASGWSNYLPHCEVRNCPPIEAAENINVLSTSYDEEYSVGQVVRFECKDPNLKLDGSSEIFCTSDGDWNLNTPSCVEISCKTPVIDNGGVNNPKMIYNNKEVIQFTCKEGFTPSTSREVTCSKDGWNPNPSCNEIFCSLYSQVEKGKLIGRKAQYKYGEEIDVKCEEGYVLQQQPNERRRCTSNGWYPPMRCVSKQCDRPNIQNGNLYTNYYFPRDIGRSIDYRCDSNYLPPERSYWGRSKCTKAGWNPEPKCSRQCALNKAFENAYIIDQQYSYVEGETVRFQCISNYQTPEGKNYGERKCLPNGEFIPAECSRRCQAPEIPNGVFKSSKIQFEIGESLQYECNKGYMTQSRDLNAITQCLGEGWSGPPRCISITCEYDRVLYGDGDVIDYTCPPGKRPIPSAGQCFIYGWGPPPNCQDIECTIPDTSDLILSPHRPSYRIGSAVSFSCKKGFERDGPLERVCTTEGWNPSSPTCKKITDFKCFIPETDNLIRNPLKVTYKGNDQVSVICEEGFTQKGPNKTTCTENSWDPPLPICEEKKSVQPDTTSQPPDEKQVEVIEPDSVAPTPDSKDKTVEPTEPDSVDQPPDSKEKPEQRQKCPLAYSPKNLEIIDPKEAYYSNDMVTMKCDIGYKMTGSPTVRCIEGKWEQPPVCTRLTPCRKPQAIRNGVIIESFKQKTYVTDDIVKFQCNPGYHISGSEEITCGNGQWSAIPTCTEDSCDAAPEVLHATVLEEKKTYNHGETAKYECDNGFRISGDNSASCVKGNWYNVPTCVATSCNRPPPVPNARINGQAKASYASGEKVTYSCHPDYSLERSFTGEAVCKNTQWTEVPVCRKIGAQCGPPPVVQFGDTTKFLQTSYKSGDSVEYKCPAYYILKGNKIVRCLNGVWEEAPVCLEPCTAKEKDMNDNNIQLRYRNDAKLYSEHHDNITFMCKSGYEAPPDTQMRIACEQGKLEYPKCFKTGYCVLDQQTMITNNIHYNVSTVVDHGQRITFECNGGMMPEDKLEAKCDGRKINYPKCTASKSCKTPEILNGFLRSEQQASYHSGSYVEFQCNDDYVINGRINVKCDNGQWTDLPVCLSPCKISTEDLSKHNIQLLPSADPKNIHRHGTELSVTCKSGFSRPNQAALVTECDDGKFRYPRCLSGKTCRLDQDKIDENNLELDEVHNNEGYYENDEKIQFKCKNGFYSRNKPTGTCSGQTLNYPTCAAKSSK